MSNFKPYSESHPEMFPGEKWMCNILEGAPVGWVTGRIGRTAYWDDGKVAEGLRPLFALKKEVSAAPEHVGLDGIIHICHESRVPWHEAESYQLVKIETYHQLKPENFGFDYTTKQA